MTYRKTRMLAASAAALLVFGCASVQSQWKTAAATNTFDSYQSFARKHATSPYADSARLAIERLEFEGVDKQHTVAAYQSFIKGNPKSSLVAKAEDRIDELAFQAAVASNTVAGYMDFMAKHPASPRIAAARQNVDKLKADLVAKEPAVSKEVLARYPASSRKGEIPARYVGNWVCRWDGVASDYLLITSSQIIWKALDEPNRGEYVFKPGSYEVGPRGLSFTVKGAYRSTPGSGDKMSIPVTIAAEPGGLKADLAQSQITVKGKLTDMNDLMPGVRGVQLNGKVRLTMEPSTWQFVKAGAGS
jgi:hypothetical protein